MVANEPSLSARTIAGRYRLGSRLGTSLEAAVFEAFDEQLRRSVVLKLVHPDLSDITRVQRFFEEAMPIAASLHHPNIAAVHDWGRASWNDREVLYVASERLVGGSLRDLLDRGRLLSPSQALLVGLDACKALDAMHREGLVHTDVRPSTLLFGDDRTLRVVDVGLAQVLHDAAGDVTARTVDRAKYASPEEAQGLPMQPKSDVYSLCLSLLEAVTGNVPFEGESAVATLANRVDRLMPVSADFGPLASVFERAGRPDAGTRYTAAEFGRALVQSAEQMPRPAPLPILANSLFAPDAGGSDQPVEPTGPLVRPDAVVPPATPVAAAVETALIATVPSDEVTSAPIAAEPIAPDADGAAEGAATDAAVTSSVASSDAPVVASDTPVTEGINGAAVAGAAALTLEAPAASPLPPPTPTGLVLTPLAVPPAPATVSPGTVSPEPVSPEPVSPEPVSPADAPTAALPTLAEASAAAPAAEAPSATTATPTTATPTTAPPTTATPASAPATTAPATAAMPVVADGGVEEFDPADEFPEHAPTVGGGRRWFIALLVLMAIGGGVLAWYNTRPETTTVPDLAGMRQGAALNQVGPFKATITEEASETVEAGVVIRTEPGAGTDLENGKTINIFVSTGPAPRALPELAGLTVADATAALDQLGLVLIEADPAFDETVAPGVIISWTVPAAPTLTAGATVTKGTTVQVVASSGPAPRTVPDLTNVPLADANLALQALGLAIVQLPDEFSNTVPIGAVVRQDVAPGSAVARGATVSVVVSKGPDLVAMPSLTGLDYNGMVAALQAAGLAVGTVTGDTTQPFQSASVSGSAVVDGQQFLRGTAVDLAFAPTPPTTTVVAG